MERPGWIVWQGSLQSNWDRQNFSPAKVIFLINSYLFTEGALNFSPTKRILLLILVISDQPVGEKCHTI